MVQTTAIHQPFHLRLLPMPAASQRILNVEILEYMHGQQTLYQQNLISLGADTELPEISDEKDITIAVLEGEGNLKLNQDTIPLELGRLVFIPAYLPHTIQAQTHLTFLLSRCEPDPSSHDSAWLITL